MGHNTFLVLALCYLRAAAQSPEQHVLSAPSEYGTSRWPFNFTSSAPHIFGSVHGLLQQWPNTFFPIGHSIVPCEVKPFTNLYHGRLDADMPPSPEWVAFDIEMAYGIMGSTQNSHILTYQTTKPLKCLYFDGMSAALSNRGEMDGQMQFIYGNISGPPDDPSHWRGLFDEYDRADKLCRWAEDQGLGGPGWGVEGIVRMNAGFEMIVCNFTSPTLRLTSHLNVSAPLLDRGDDDDDDEEKWDTKEQSSYLYPLPTATTSTPERSTSPPNPPMPPNWRRDTGLEPFLQPQTWGWLRSATWHYGSTGMGPGTGESRVRPLTCGFASFHADKFSSLQQSRVSLETETFNLTSEGFWKGANDHQARKRGLQDLLRRRRTPRLINLSAGDAAQMNADMSRILESLGFGEQSSPGSSESACSGIEWDSPINQIVTRYSNGLPEFLKTIIKTHSALAQNYTVFRSNLTVVRYHTHSFLVPFLEYPTQPTDVDAAAARVTTWSRNSALARDTYSRCKYHHTRLLQPSEGIFLSPEETILKEAIEETMGAICEVLVTVGFATERIWLSTFNAYDGSHKDNWRAGLEDEMRHWQYGMEELLAWLGWAGNAAKCERTCDVDEQCFIPMWPLMNRGRFGGGPPHGGGPPRYRNPYNRRPGGRHGEAIIDTPEDHPGHGPPAGPGNGPPPGPPGGFFNDEDLWAPKCVKNDYLTQG